MSGFEWAKTTATLQYDEQSELVSLYVDGPARGGKIAQTVPAKEIEVVSIDFDEKGKIVGVEVILTVGADETA